MQTVRKEFWRYVSLGILGMLGSSGTILVDTFFVSHRLGSQGLAALNLAISVFGLINGVGMMLGVGGATCYTLSRSKGREREANQSFTRAFFLAWSMGLCLLLAGLFLSPQLAQFLGADAETLPLCESYLKTVLCFAPCFLLHHLFLHLIRHDGNPKLSMWMMMTGSLANIVLDYLFLYPLNLGIFGAALATGLAPVIGLGLASLHFLRKQNGFRVVRTTWGWNSLRTLLAPGLASFSNEFSSSLVLVVFNLLILQAAGNLGVAAYGIVANLALVVLAVFTGVSQGVQPLLCRAYGEGDAKKVRDLYQRGMLLALMIGGSVFLAASLFPSPLISLFNSENNPTLQALAEEGMRIYFLGFLFVGCNVLTATLFSTTDRVRPAFALSAFRGCLGILPVACLFSAVWGLQGIWLSFPTVELAAMAAGALCMRSGRLAPRSNFLDGLRFPLFCPFRRFFRWLPRDR